MTEPWILAIDLGNGGPKTAAVALDGRILASARRGVTVQIGSDGEATQDAAEWDVLLAEAVRELLDDASVDGARLHAVAVTGQWGSTVPVGADARPCGPVLLWADTRAAPHSARVVGGGLTVAGYNPRKTLPWLRRTGGAPTPTGGDPTGHSLLLRHDLPRVAEQVRWLMEPVDYLAFRCSGRALATPASMVLSWLTDNRLGAPVRYDDALIARARRDPYQLPDLVPTGTVAGPLLPEVARAFGVRPGAPVITGIPDFLAAVLGSGAVEPYQTHLAISTTAWLAARVPFKRTDLVHQIASVPGLDPAHHVVINNIDSAGAALTWLREQVVAPPDGLLGGGSGIGASGAADPGAEPSYEALLALAGTVPAGSEGVLFTPWLAGERSPVEDKALRAAWLNLSFRTDRAALIRSVLEGVAYNVRWLFDPYERFLGRRVESVRLLGGGAQSDLWAQIIAGVLDRRVERMAEPRSAQLRGTAAWARVCLGEWSLSDVAAAMPVDRVFLPEGPDRVEYQRLYGVYRKLYGRLKGTYADLNRA